MKAQAFLLGGGQACQYLISLLSANHAACCEVRYSGAAS
jgi:hypothetical protein